jgi:copper homeostasis protein
LTSGGPGNAIDNLNVVKGIVEAMRGTLEIIVGGGVRSGNIPHIFKELDPVKGRRVVYHSSCLTNANGHEEVDVEEVRSIVDVLEWR